MFLRILLAVKTRPIIKADTESPSARQTNHLLSLIDINKAWENAALMFVIKNTQNTNHYLISAGLKITRLGSLRA